MRKTAHYQNQPTKKESLRNIDTTFSDKEKLWKYFFGSEYKPEVKIDFQKLKNYINKNKEENSRRVLRDYNYRLGSPEDLCDYLIQNDISTPSITSLESLTDNQKRCLADIFLELIPFDHIKEKLGIAMLFWIWHYGYYYSKRHREKLKEYLISNSTTFSSDDDFESLQRSFETQNRINKYTKHNIITTLLGYIIEKDLQQTLEEKNIDQYLRTKLGGDFSFQKFSPCEDNTLGNEKNRSGKDLDKDGNLIERKRIDKMSKYIKEIINGKESSLKVVDRENNSIYSDRSGKIYKVFLDGPISFSLFYKKEPIALISFCVKTPENIFINQMQAIPSEKFDRYGRTTHSSVDPIVNSIDWQQILYDILTLLARKYEFKNIIIQAGKNNKRINKNRDTLEYDDKRKKRVEIESNIPHLSLDIAQKIYDNFAKGHSFKKEKSSGDWKKKI